MYVISLSLYTYIYIYIYEPAKTSTYVYIYIYIYIFLERETEICLFIRRGSFHAGDHFYRDVTINKPTTHRLRFKQEA